MVLDFGQNLFGSVVESKEIIISIPGVLFTCELNATDSSAKNEASVAVGSPDGDNLVAPLMLPNGITIDSIHIIGSVGINNATFKINYGGSNGLSNVMATGLCNTKVAVNGVIDNTTYGYSIGVIDLAANDVIYYVLLRCSYSSDASSGAVVGGGGPGTGGPGGG